MRNLELLVPDTWYSVVIRKCGRRIESIRTETTKATSRSFELESTHNCPCQQPNSLGFTEKTSRNEAKEKMSQEKIQNLAANEQSKTANTADNSANSSMNWERIMESVVRVTLAGLGGSIVGLAQERRLESMRVVSGAAATAAARRKRSPSSQLTNLPLTWALSCIAFCGIVETSRLTSPSKNILIFLESLSEEGDTDGQTKSLSNRRLAPYFCTVADYSLGGIVGGLASSLGQNSHIRRNLPSAMARGSHRFFGVGPGFGLGFMAGLLQAVTDASVTYFEDQQR